MDRSADRPAAERPVGASVVPAAGRRDVRAAVRGVTADAERHGGAGAPVSQFDLFAGASARASAPQRAGNNLKAGAPNHPPTRKSRKSEARAGIPGASGLGPTHRALPEQPATAAGLGMAPRGHHEVPAVMSSPRVLPERSPSRSRPPGEAVSRGATTTKPQRIPRLFTVADAAEFLRVCTKTVRRAIERGDLRSHHVGRQVRVSEEDLMAFLNRGRR